MMRPRSERCVSDLRLDRSLAGELSHDEQRQLQAHLHACDGCRMRHAEVLESRRRFARDAPPWATLAVHERQGSPRAPFWAPAPGDGGRLPSPGRGRRLAGALRASAALAALAALALAVTQPWTRTTPREVAGAETRAKGSGATLGWVVRRGDRVFSGGPQQRLRAGDAVRFTVSSHEVVYVAVLGLDTSGRVSVYHPDGERLSRVEAGRDQLLSTAIELDATPGEERLYGIFCADPVPVSQVTAAVERAPASPPLPPDCSVERSTLRREAP